MRANLRARPLRECDGDCGGDRAPRIGAQAIVTAVAISLIFGAVILVLWSGAHDVIAGRMSAGALGQFVLYALIGGGSVGALAEVWNELQRAAGGMGRINELLQETPGIVAPATPVALPRPRARRDRVRCGDASTIRSAPTPPRCDDFSLHVQPGETVALVGPSGAGKSTVFSLLLRFHDPQAGRIALDGIDLRELDPARLRDAIALVPQSPTIFATSATDNIRYGKLDASDDDVRQAARIGRGRRASSMPCRTASPANSANAARACPAASSSASRSPAPCSRTRRSCCWTKPPRALDAQSERAVQHALENLMARPHHAGDRASAGHRAQGRPHRGDGRAGASSPRVPMQSCWPRTACMRNWRGCSSSTDQRMAMVLVIA